MKSMNTYLDVVYNKKQRPYTDYPSQLCRHLFEMFSMKKGDKLLDVGCGRGDFTKGFKDMGLEVAGIDREKGDSEMLQGIEVKISSDIEHGALPFESERFDVVFSKSVIEHLREPDNFMKEVCRVLKPGGRIITMTPDWRSQIYIFYNDYTHVHPYTPEGLRRVHKVYGFKDVSSKLFYQLPALWKYPWLRIISKMLQLAGPVQKLHKNKFIRWSRELMILATGVK